MLNIPRESVPIAHTRGGSAISGSEISFSMLKDWVDFIEAQGLAACMHTAIHPLPTDRAWWIAAALRVVGSAIHFHILVMHHGQLVQDTLAWRDVPTDAWLGLTADPEYTSYHRLQDHLKSF